MLPHHSQLSIILDNIVEPESGGTKLLTTVNNGDQQWLSRYKKECTYAQQNITKYNINSNINVAYKINEFDYSVSIPYEKYHPTLLFCLLNASQLH